MIIYIIVWTILFLDKRESRYNIVGRYLLRNNFNPEFIKIKNLQLSPQQERKLQEISESQDANVIIYGGFSPFVGSGINIDGWSFAVDINKGKEEMGVTNTPLDFQVSELYDYISDSIKNLEIGGLSIEDNLYINGQEIRDEKYFLSTPLMRPNTRIKDDYMNLFIEQPTHSIRHYRCVRITDWKAELILSIFFRFSKIGKFLFIEANYYLLTPLRSYYRQYDAIKSQPSNEDIRKLALESAFTTFALSIFATIFIPIYILNKLWQIWQKYTSKKNVKREIRANHTFNYGSINSLRERVSQEEYQRFFQKLDQEMYLKIIERKIVDGLSNFLDSKNINTSDFKQARETILNHGIMVSGGSIQAENLAVGKGAKSIFSNVLRKRAKLIFIGGGAAGPTAGTDDDGK